MSGVTKGVEGVDAAWVEEFVGRLEKGAWADQKEAARIIRALRSEVERLRFEVDVQHEALRWYQERFGGVDNGKCRECGGYRDYDHGEPERCANAECLSNRVTGQEADR